MWKVLRVSILFLILIVVVRNYIHDKNVRQFKTVQTIIIYPVLLNKNVERYVTQINTAQFEEINQYIQTQARRYGKNIPQPFRILVAPPLTAIPPAPPNSERWQDSLLWSLKFRLFAWQHSPKVNGFKPDIRLYAFYYEPADNTSLPHSVALQKGMLGLTHLFAASDFNAQNNVVITHEIFHLLGASDKYDLMSGLPLAPEGLGEPDKQPLYPQKYAEIMGGFIAINQANAEMPEDLSQTKVGEKTAQEVEWHK